MRNLILVCIICFMAAGCDPDGQLALSIDNEATVYQEDMNSVTGPFEQPLAVPEPATLLLFGIPMTGLIVKKLNHKRVHHDTHAQQ